MLERPTGEVSALLRDTAAAYAAEGRGFDLREIAGGWRFYTREECAPVVERFISEGQEVRLTQAALETLSVVAYRQPVSRARVSAVRGVNCDGVMRTLTLRGLVEDAGTDPETGAILYRTTGYFLERLGLASLEDLPDLAPFLPDSVEGVEDGADARRGAAMSAPGRKPPRGSAGRSSRTNRPSRPGRADQAGLPSLAARPRRPSRPRWTPTISTATSMTTSAMSATA